MVGCYLHFVELVESAKSPDLVLSKRGMIDSRFVLRILTPQLKYVCISSHSLHILFQSNC